ncbi:MAG: nickel pincer cofactor biosynthesis protein LarC [Acidobacteriia bacterium]|nr:nickel pincer cofactor biosynthesis protein LarC [Terriglobia bacterium]
MSRPERTLYVDATAGAAGDMILGALIDLGVPLSKIRAALRTLPFRGWTLASRRVVRTGLSALQAVVRVTDSADERGWREIRRIVGRGRLASPVRARALRIFRRLVEAEAEAHGKAPDEVHLHEAGAIDAIVDVVGTSVALHELAPDRIVVSRMTTGSGRVVCRHGSYPVPGPATAVLVRGAPITGDGAEGERLTPTGAAILTTVADAWGTLPAGRIVATGHGAGEREFDDRPNVLRMVLVETDGASAPPPAANDVVVIEVTLDDAPPQVVAYAAERLFAEGALEVFTTPVHMKKGRSGHLLTVLARPDRLDALAGVVLRETPTLGLRYRREGRIELDRRTATVTTPFGRVRLKEGLLGGSPIKAWPEYEDCARLARSRGVPLKRVQEAALLAFRRAGAPARGRAPRRKAR